MDNNSTLIDNILPLKGINTYIKNIFLVLFGTLLLTISFENTSSFLACTNDYANFYSFNYCNDIWLEAVFFNPYSIFN